MASEPTERAGARRLHPSTLVFTIGRALRNLLIPAVLALIGGRGSVWETIFFAMFAFATVRAVIHYLKYSWELRSEDLVVKEGVFFRRERHIPYTRIQNMDRVQNLFHRLFGVAEVRLETAAGSEPEAVLRVLAIEDVDRVRKRMLAAPDAGAEPTDAAEDPAEAAGPPLVTIPPSHLVLLGLILNRGVAVIGVGLGLLYELDAFDAFFRWLGLEQKIEALAEAGIVGAILQVLVLLGAAAVVLVGLSIAWSLLRFFGFTLRAVGNDLRLSCGLFTRIFASIPRTRIQALTIEASWLHRLFHLASIKAQTAGGDPGKETAGVLRRHFVPVLPEVDVPRVVSSALPGIGLDDLDWRLLSRTATRRLRRRALLVIGVLGLPAVYFTPFALLAILLAAAIAWVHAGAWVRRARYARTAWGLVWQRGIVTRETTLLANDKIQTVRVVRSPFDRRHGHATLFVDAAGGGVGTSEMNIRCLDEDVAEALRRNLSRSAAVTAYAVRKT